MKPFPFLDLCDDLQIDIINNILDSATRVSLALTCADYYERFYDKSIFGVRFLKEAINCSTWTWCASISRSWTAQTP